MSRTDQAWRRATGAHLTEQGGGPEASVLDSFPQGGGSPPRHDVPGIETYRLFETAGAAAPASESGGEGAWDRGVVVGRGAPPLAVEQYRRLAGTLHGLQRERGLKTLMVTSAVRGEGKTLTIVNLAVTLSEAFEHRVLLVDADVRRPAVHRVLGLPNERGLGDLLSSEDRDVPLVHVSKWLSVLPSGRRVQPMALTSDRMRTLLDRAAKTFDWVLLDAAPVGFMPDAEVLAPAVGAVLFVIAAKSTPHALVERAIASLDPDCLVGTVLNSVAPRDIPAAAYYAAHDDPDGNGD